MPCNAKVVQYAKMTVTDIQKILQAAKNKGLRIVETENSVRLAFGDMVTVEISRSGEVVMRSTSDDWETGVEQLRRVQGFLNASVAPLSDVGDPETHRHDEAGPWQLNTVRG